MLSNSQHPFFSFFFLLAGGGGDINQSKRAIIDTPESRLLYGIPLNKQLAFYSLNPRAIPVGTHEDQYTPKKL